MAEAVATGSATVAKRRWGAVKLTPSHRLYGLGAILLVALTICARQFNGQGEAFPILPLLVAGVAYLLAIREFFCTPSFPKRVIVIGLVLAALWHVAFLRIPTGSDDDVRRYVWDGRMQRLGYNPYIVVPSDPAVAALHTVETRTLNNPDLPSPYPPGAQLFFRAVTAIHESPFAMRVAFVICDLAIVLVLLDVLRRTGQGVHWILAYAWNPLLATEVAGSGHVDIRRRASAGGVVRRADTPLARHCGRRVRAGDRGEVSPDCAAAALLAAGSASRRSAGSNPVRTSVSTVSQPRANSHGLARHLHPELSF